MVYTLLSKLAASAAIKITAWAIGIPLAGYMTIFGANHLSYDHFSSETRNGICVIEVSSAEGALGRTSMRRYYDVLNGNKPMRDEIFHKEFGQELVQVYDISGNDQIYDGKADIVCVGESSPGKPRCFNRREDRAERKDLFDLADQLLEETREKSDGLL
jgi:hypothetical protein